MITSLNDLTCFIPPLDYQLGIRGGPMLTREIYNSDYMTEPLSCYEGKYALIYSPVAPSGQKLALTLAMSNFLNIISVLSVKNGRLISYNVSDKTKFKWITPSKQELNIIESTVGRVRLPALVNLETGQVISNDPYRLPYKFIIDLSNEVDIVPLLIDKNVNSTSYYNVESDIFYKLHAAVYRAGFLKDQSEYETEVQIVYAYLNHLNNIFNTQLYLLGEKITLPDIWLFSLLIRYDQVYAPGFRLHKYRLRDFSGIWRYLKSLYSIEAFSFTTDFDSISRGYFLGIPALNRGIIPNGPNDFFLLTS